MNGASTFLICMMPQKVCSAMYNFIGRPLFFLGMYLYDNYNLKFLYNISEATMAKFFETVESSYRVRYH
jgi:hypothetical protein